MLVYLRPENVHLTVLRQKVIAKDYVIFTQNARILKSDKQSSFEVQILLYKIVNYCYFIKNKRPMKAKTK